MLQRFFSLSNVYQYVDIWHPDVAVEILFLLNVVFGDIDYQFNDAEQEEDSFALQDFEFGTVKLMAVICC